MDKKETVSHVIVNNMGGITSLIQHLILYCGDTALEQELILLEIDGNINTPAIIDSDINCNIIKQFVNPLDNWYSTFDKMHRLLSKTNGILVSNDQYDLIMLQAFNIPKNVVQIIHDLYNLELAKKYHNSVDVFIAHSKYIFNQLSLHFPDRLNDIFYIPYGIPLRTNFTKKFNSDFPLRLIFLGRHTATKGIHDLILINQILASNNIEVQWTILGNGPETSQLLKQWEKVDKVTFKHPSALPEILNELLLNDILVLPTKFEGLPVSMLEAMSMGCIPIVTNLEGGIQDIVEDGFTGFKCSIDDNFNFAEQIIKLHFDRSLLHNMQHNARKLIINGYNANIQMPKYQDVFKTVIQRGQNPRHHNINHSIGSRLDNKWIPNFLTRNLRKLLHVS